MHMFYENGHQFGGMHFIWWFLWVGVMIWIFATPYNIPGQRKRKDSPLEILQRRFASGEITKDEYLNLKETLAKDSIQINTQ